MTHSVLTALGQSIVDVLEARIDGQNLPPPPGCGDFSELLPDLLGPTDLTAAAGPSSFNVFFNRPGAL